MTWEFASAGRVVFGSGAAGKVGEIAAEIGKRVLLVTGSRPGRVRSIADALKASSIEFAVFATEGEPAVETVRAGVAAVRSASAQLIVAAGGGSAIDAGKAIAGIAANSGEPLDYMEVVGKGQALARPALPVIAVPTTAGTGSEVTRNAVLGSPEHSVKASVRHASLLPRVAVIDPDLTLTLPPAITASTGLDALTQLIEPFVSARANTMTDLFCLNGVRRISRSLPRAWTDGRDLEARTDMSFASLLGGLALANAGLGIVHGFAAPIGGMFDASHGAVCAALLPGGTAANIRALRERAPDHPSLEKYRQLAVELTGNLHARAEDLAPALRALTQSLRIQPLSAYGIGEAHLPELVRRAATASSTKSNPIILREEELLDIVRTALN